MNWRSVALAALWALVAATFALAAFALWRSQPITDFAVLTAARTMLSALVLVWWTQVFSRYTARQGTAPENGALRALRAAVPWLLGLRLALWSLNVLALSSGAAAEANTVAITALLTIDLGFALAKNAVYGTLARWAGQPGEGLGRVRLMGWLNVAAALSLGIGVINIVPIAGLPGKPDLPSAIVYGLHAALDVLAALLALKAVQAMPGRAESTSAEDAPW